MCPGTKNGPGKPRPPALGRLPARPLDTWVWPVPSPVRPPRKGLVQGAGLVLGVGLPAKTSVVLFYL